MKNNSAQMRIKILVTSTPNHAKPICEQITLAGDEPIHIPLFGIKPIEQNFSKRFLASQDWIIFVSRASVDNCVFTPSAKQRYAAIGQQTALSLIAKNIENVTYNQDAWSSEGLLSLPEFQKVKGKKITIIKGKGGLEILRETLTKRGAIVNQFAVYERVILQKNLKLPADIDIIIAASLQSLHGILTMIDAVPLFSIPLIVPSERVQRCASNLGFKQVFIAQNAGAKAMMNTIKKVKTTFKADALN